MDPDGVSTGIRSQEERSTQDHSNRRTGVTILFGASVEFADNTHRGEDSDTVTTVSPAYLAHFVIMNDPSVPETNFTRVAKQRLRSTLTELFSSRYQLANEIEKQMTLREADDAWCRDITMVMMAIDDITDADVLSVHSERIKNVESMPPFDPQRCVGKFDSREVSPVLDRANYQDSEPGVLDQEAFDGSSDLKEAAVDALTRYCETFKSWTGYRRPARQDKETDYQEKETAKELWNTILGSVERWDYDLAWPSKEKRHQSSEDD